MIYLIIIISLFYLSFKYDGHTVGLTNKQNSGIYYIVFWLIILAGCSKNIGGDVYVTYWPEFSKSPTLGQITFENLLDPESLPASNFKYKPLYLLTRSLIRSLTNEFWIYHIFHAIFINTVIFIFLKKRTSYLCLSLLYYFVINYFEYNTEVIRESLAVAMGLLAFNQLEKKRILNYLLLALGAYLFHTSGLIVLLMPLGLVLNKIPSKYVLFFFILLAIILPVVYAKTNFSLIIDLLGALDQDQMYRLNQEVETGYNLNFYIVHYFKFLILPYLLLFFTPKKYKLKYLGLVYLYLLFRVMGMYSEMFYRFGNYYAPFFWMFMATTSFAVSSYFKSRTRIIVILSIFFLFFSLNSIYLFSKDNSGLGIYIYQRYIPYKSIMFI